MNPKVFLAATIAALLSAQPAWADATPQCELHVWPANGLRSVYHGWLHGGIVDGSVKGRDGYPAIPADPIDTKVQHDALAALDLPALAGLTSHKLVLHDDSLSSTVIRGTPGRIIADAAPCYAELIVDDVFFQEDVVEGPQLRALIRFRDFGSNATPIRSFGTFIQTKLKIFPPKLPQDNESALAEIRAAFTSNVTRFGELLKKPVKAK